MASSLGDFPPHYLRDRILRRSATIILGLAVTWTLIAAAFGVEVIRSHYEGMTSFAPLATVFTVVFSPLWIGIHFLVLRYSPPSARSVAGVVTPTIIIVALSLVAIWILNTAWMADPHY